MAEELNRRNFIKAAALAAGPAIISARGANDKINVGWIGVGTRGRYGLEWLHTAAPADTQITAVCDTYKGYINRAVDTMQTTWGTKPETFVDYKELLAKKDIDAVFIMTPEHLHHDMAIAALNAGKHVYVEKPLAHTVEEGWDIIKAWEDANKKKKVICQVGTQNRSSSLYKKAKEMIKQGMVGDVHYVRAFWYRNGLPTAPSWRYVIPAEATPENTDWKRFLGTAPKREWDPHRYFQWRLYWDYSGGISTDLLVHQTDIVNFMLDKTIPKSCMASGGVYRWTENDDRDVPDTLSAIYEYDKMQLNYSCYIGNEFFGYGEEICGNEGTIRVMNRTDLWFEHEQYNSRRPGASDQAPAAIKARAAVHINGPQEYKEVDGVINHFKNFVESIKGTEQPIAPPPVGQEAAIGGHMATQSYKNKKMALWDAGSKKIKFG
jgi:predicted dehydrogenase